MGRKTKMNSITSPELLSQVNKENQDLAKEFLEYMKATQKSAGTINGYTSDLNIFFVWVLKNAKNKPFRKISKRDIIAFQNWLIYENENSPARVRRLKAAISSLSNYCENILADDDDDYDGYRSIVRKIDNPPMQTVREKTVWADEELEQLLVALTEKKEYEKACYVAVGMYGGRRKSEIARFKVSDFDDSMLVCDGALYKSAPILTKGAKYLECYTLAKRVKPYLDAWMNYRKEKGIESEWLFPDALDPTIHVKDSTLNSWAKTFDAITDKAFYAHSLRHYFVSALSRAGIPDNVVVQIIGWSSAEMFNVYNDNSKDDQIGQFFSNGDISVPDKKGFSDV